MRDALLSAVTTNLMNARGAGDIGARYSSLRYILRFEGGRVVTGNKENAESALYYLFIIYSVCDLQRPRTF
jgi:hypothetical protein